MIALSIYGGGRNLDPVREVWNGGQKGCYYRRSGVMIERAAAFAEKAHRGVFRKGTNVPYITHPMETAVIVSAFTDDEELIAAALLHDVIEDAGISREELGQVFGRRVASLVQNESEDKSRSWRERKANTLKRLNDAPWETKILTLGDKLSNIRCTARDYMILGEDIWQRFNEKDKNRHAWYYWGISHRLRELEDHLYFKEYEMLCCSVFGRDRSLTEEDVFPD